MPKSELVVGLDLGTTKICAVVGQITESNEIEIIGIGLSPSTGLRNGIVINIDQTVASIKKAIEDAEMMAGCEIRTVYVGIAGSHIQCLNSNGLVAVNGKEVTESIVNRALEIAKTQNISSDHQIIHTLPQEYIVDKYTGITHPIGMTGVRLEAKVHVITAAVSSIQNIVRCCRKAGLDVTKIILEPLASAEAVLTPEEREVGVALIDLGGGTSDVIIYHKKAVKYTASVDFAGHIITQDIANVMHIPTSKAEKMKTQYGCIPSNISACDEADDESRQMLANICETRIIEILTDIDKLIIEAGCKNIITKVVLTGGTSLLAGIEHLAQDIFGLPACVRAPHDVKGLKDTVSSPKFATAVGLLQYGAFGQEGDTGFQVHGDEPGLFQGLFKWIQSWFRVVS